MTRATEIETGHKVLLVDDDAVSLELLAVLLAHEGHQVLRASDAGAALALLATEKAARPDVLLVDLQMPGVSGGQLAEKIRALEGPEPLLLAMSATEVNRGQLCAFDGFLLKPLALDELRRALKPKKNGRRPGIRMAHPGRGAAVSAKGEVLDMAVIGKMLTMMPMQALHEVFTACIADTRACVDALMNQPQERPGTGVRQYAHRIKGAASMIGATRIAKLAAELERGGGKETNTPGLLDDLLSACSELERMLLAGKLETS